MKRVKAACICQTLLFLPKEGASGPLAADLVLQEVALYKKRLEQNCTQYKIIREARQDDGSVLLDIVKQYNDCPVGRYLDEANP